MNNTAQNTLIILHMHYEQKNKTIAIFNMRTMQVKCKIFIKCQNINRGQNRGRQTKYKLQIDVNKA